MDHRATFLLQPAWLPPLPSVDVTANLPGYIILSGYQTGDAFTNNRAAAYTFTGMNDQLSYYHHHAYR